MDDFNEMNGFPQEPVENQTPAPEQTPAEAALPQDAPEAPVCEEAPRETFAAEDNSPFADSPYYAYRDGAGAHPSKPPKAKRTGSKKNLRPVAAAVLAVALVGGSCGITAAAVNHHWKTQTSRMEQTLNQKITDLQNRLNSDSTGNAVPGSPVANVEGMTPGQVYAQNVSSVVAISNKGITTNVFGQVSETASSGSGFIISEDGYVVTNYHVVQNATTLTVITTDSTEYPAELVGYDQSNDVALLKIDAKGLTPVTIGSSDELRVGDQVAAIGNPLGELTSSLTVGYVSAKDRTINTDGTYINMVQIDAAINPGNSGGPLFNMKGEVIGINTAKYSGSTGSGATIEGIGFAIPIDDVLGMVEDIKEHGYVTGAYLGVSVVGITDDEVSRYGLPKGCYVDSVVDGSCAQKAGLQRRDIITGLGSYDVTGNTDLTRALRKFKPGDTTTITVYRAGQTLDLTITLDEKPAPQTPPTQPSGQEQMPSGQMPEGQIPESGSYEDWFNYFAPFFGGRG